MTHLSLDVEESLEIESSDVVRAVFYGLGADGTVSSNKASIKILGEETELFAQGHFVYDSKKAGSTTVSHLRFGPRPIRSTYQIAQAEFVAIHDPGFLDRLDVLDRARDGATVLLNTSVATRARLGRAAPRGAGNADRPAMPAVRDRRLSGGGNGRSRPADQHRHAGLFLRAGPRAAGR